MTKMTPLALVTGGSSGIGLSAAHLLAKRGYNLVLVARDQKKLERAQKALVDENSGCDVRVLSLDVAALGAANFEKSAAAVRKVVERDGAQRVDLLLNAAGAAFPGTLDGREPELIERTINLNLRGLALFTRIALPMVPEGGRIVNVSSLGGIFPVFGYTDYGAAKAGVIAFSDALRSELKPKGIKVQVLCPPDTDTPGFANENLTKPEETAEISAKAKLFTPDQVAAVLMKGIDRGKFMILPDFESKLNWFVARLSPGLVRGIFDADIRKVQARRQRGV